MPYISWILFGTMKEPKTVSDSGYHSALPWQDMSKWMGTSCSFI